MQTEVEEFTMRDRLGPVAFKGHILADCRYGRLDSPRWTDMALYKIADPTGTRRSAQVIEKELVRDLSRELPFREMPRSKRTVLLDSVMTQVLPRLVNDQPVYRYVLALVARSFVYHRAEGPCVRDRHRIVSAGDVRFSNHRWQHLFPCNRCQPNDLENLNDNARIAEERDKHHLYLCTDASDVLSRLYRRNGEISELAAKLIVEASERDPEIARTMHSNRRV